MFDNLLTGFSNINILGVVLFAIGGVVSFFAYKIIKKLYSKMMTKFFPEDNPYKQPPTAPIIPPAVQVASPSGYTCKCGYNHLELKEMRRHMLTGGKKDGKGIHGYAKPDKQPEVKSPYAPPADAARVDQNGKYKAYVWEPNPGIVPCKITKPVGTIWLAEPTLPISGACYFCKRGEHGELVPYDPRLDKYDDENSTEQLFRFIEVEDVVHAVYTAMSTLWDKFNTLAPYITAGLMLLAVIVKAAS